MHTSLAAIGRATCIEADDPPSDVDDDLSDDAALLDGLTPTTCATPPPPPAAVTLEELGELTEESERKFVHLPRHQAVLNRSVASLGMLHSRPQAEVGRLLGQLHACAQRLHVVDLQKTIAAHLQEFKELVREVERLVGQEAQLLAAFRCGDAPSSASTRLSCVRAICESLRLCKNQLAIVRNSVQQSRPLQLLLRSHLRSLLQIFWSRHHHLEERCLLLTHDLIYLGLQVISHSDLTKYTHNELWEISRGIEEFNAILESVKQQRRIRLLRRALVDYHQFSFADFDAMLLEIDTVKPISFSRILFRLASERAQRAVSSIHHFYFSNRDLLRHFKQCAPALDRDLPPHPLEMALLLHKSGGGGGGKQQQQQQQQQQHQQQHQSAMRVAGDASPTSDYFSASSGAGSGDLSRLVERFARFESPTGDYLRMEYDFASNFLDIISQSTQMLKELHNPSKRRLVKEETFETFVATLPAVVSSKPARKGVQWSDHKDVSVRHHVIGRYLDLIWREFDRQFELYMALHVHCANNEAALCSLGSVAGLAPGVRLALAEVLRQTGTRDLFPPGVIPVLQKQADRLQREALVSLWDADLCRALGSSPSDNLSPTLLSGSQHSTRTGKAFLDSLRCMTRLLCCALERLQAREGREEGNESSLAAALASGLTSISLALSLISTTARASHRWHQGRVAYLLAAWKPGPLQFLLHTDVRLILERLTACLHLLRRLQAVPALLREERTMARVKTELGRLSETHQSLQALCSSTAKAIAAKSQERAAEFFSEAMPGKSHWRNMKSAQRPSGGGSAPSLSGTVGLEAQDYARGALMFLLEPVLDAVRMLPASAQITAAAPAAAALCAAWQQHILKEKLKFNLSGALQLEADVNVLSEYLHAFVDCEEVRESLLSLSSVRELQAGVQILKLQSTSGGGGRRGGPGNREDSDRSTSCSSLPCSDVDTATAQELLDLEQFHFLPSLKEWLALRTCPEEGRKFLPLCR